MQGQILSENPGSSIRILGVNETAQAAYNDLAVAGNSIPWLQDVQSEAWGGWAVTWRDVVILDAENKKVAVFNLTEHDIAGDPSEYAALLALLRSTAGE
jgi:hypothetical protein